MTRPLRDRLGENEYRCDACGGVYEKGWSEEEAIAECQAYFPGTSPKDCGILCDDCHLRFMQWMRDEGFLPPAH